jgi:hypothetical protein
VIEIVERGRILGTESCKMKGNQGIMLNWQLQTLHYSANVKCMGREACMGI